MESHYTVAQYLKTRLEQLGLDRMFGVAGNYTAAFLNTILADKTSPIVISHNANEICAGYAADAYARLKGIGALYVTYSVGAFSLLNTIAGSYTEQVPLVLINGAPTNKEDSVEKNAGLLYAHTTGYQTVDIHMFRPVTVAAERITNARQATYQIDSALTAMLTHKRPVYLEITEDTWRTTCQAPAGVLRSGADDTRAVSETAQAVTAAMALIQSKPKSLFWAGIELQRFGLEKEFLRLLDVVNTRHAVPGKEIHFVTSVLSKSVISEDNKYFEGCVTMTQTELQHLVGDDGCLIGLGAWTTGKDTNNQNIRSANTILASHNNVWVGALFFPIVSLASFIKDLETAFVAWAEESNQKHLEGLRIQPAPLSRAAQAQSALTYDTFFAAIDHWLSTEDILVVDSGFPLVGAQSVKIAAQDGFVAQAAWLAIGYSVAAATGVKCARPGKRAIVVMGDGAFHETCQAVADHHAYGHNTVVFVLVNGLYGIEQNIVNPNPFRTPVIHYSDTMLDVVYPYNVLPRWKYDKIPDAFGGKGRKAANTHELSAILQEIRATPDSNFVVEITIPETDVPGALRAGLDADVGEDEIQNPAWPPANIF
jgi:indolepyruvate decarboxylase